MNNYVGGQKQSLISGWLVECGFANSEYHLFGCCIDDIPRL